MTVQNDDIRLSQIRRAPPFGKAVNAIWRQAALWEHLPRDFDAGTCGVSMKPLCWVEEFARQHAPGVVFDAFSGSGAASIALIRLGNTVVASECDALAFEQAGRNFVLAGVGEQIALYHDTAERVLPSVIDSSWCYLDPPWGFHYARRERFDLGDFAVPVAPLLDRMYARGLPFALSVPINFDTADLPQGARRRSEIVWHEIAGMKCAGTLMVLP